MSEYKLIPYDETPIKLDKHTQQHIISKYGEFKSRVQNGRSNKELLYGFEIALILIGYDIEEVE